jgi:hypothetical protein
VHRRNGVSHCVFAGLLSNSQLARATNSTKRWKGIPFRGGRVLPKRSMGHKSEPYECAVGSVASSQLTMATVADLQHAFGMTRSCENGANFIQVRLPFLVAFVGSRNALQ